MTQGNAKSFQRPINDGKIPKSAFSQKHKNPAAQRIEEMKQSRETADRPADLIRAEDLKKEYPVGKGLFGRKKNVLHAVDGVSFSIREGETLGLVGESGCGKSTIGRMLVGLEQPTSGQVFYGRTDLTHAKAAKLHSVRTQLQMVFQDPYSSLNPRKHIYEILSQPMLYHKISTPETIHADVDRLLDMVGLSKSALGRYPHEFSGGQRQRIGIARALSLNPKFIVCDEPVSALDVSIQAQILNLLRSLQKDLHLTSLFVGHGLGAVRYVSTRIAVMYLGKLVEIGPADEVFRHPAHPYTQALMNAVPDPDPDLARMPRQLLEGEVGSALAPPSGCRFHPRCPYARESCRMEEPVMHAVSRTSEAHLAACPILSGRA